MFERYTDRARRVVVLAQEEARALQHNYIGTEHLLLGLIHEGQGVAATALGSLGIELEDARKQVEDIIGRGSESPGGHIPFTPRASKVQELALREALQLGHNYVGTEHLLLGLIREGEGVAAQVLGKLGAAEDRVRKQVMTLVGTLPTAEKTAKERRAATNGHSFPATVTVVDRQVPNGADRLLDLTRRLGHPVADMTLVGYEFATAENANELVETLTIRWRP